MKVGSMRKGKRILLVTIAVLLCSNGAYAGLFRRKAKPAPEATPAAAMTLTAIEADSSNITLRTSGTPAYTSYSPSPDVFVIDLTGTTRPADLTIPGNLPAAISSVSAEEAVEMGNRLTRVTFRLTEPVTPKASAAENSITVTLPMSVAEMPGGGQAPSPVQIAEATVETPAATVETTPVVTGEAPVLHEPIDMPKAKWVNKIETSGTGTSLEVQIAGDGAIAYKAFALDNPARLVIDLEGVKNKVAKSAMSVTDAPVQRIRVAQFKSDPAPVTRVVLDLNGKTEFAVTPSGDHLRVTFGPEAAKIAAAAPVIKAPQPIKVAEAPVTKPEPKIAATVEEIPAVAENATTWKMPPSATQGARQVINAPDDQVPPSAPRRSATSSTPPTPTLGGEDVFDQAQAGRGVPTTGTRQLSAGQRTFSGDPISLSLKDADIKDVLRTFAELTGLNIAVDPQVSGTVTVDFVDVPWDQALDLMLRQNGLTFTIEGNVMRVGTVERLAAETASQRRLQEEERLNVPLTTLSVKLSYARAAEVSGLLREMASPRAKIIVDTRTNQLIISEVPQYLSTMRNLIDTVDVPTRQVVIEARIVETTKTFTLAYGFNWGFNGILDPALGTGTGLVFPNRIGFTGGAFAFGGPIPILGATLVDVLGTFDLDIALAAAETETLIRVVSAPKVTTQDNTPAEIQSGVQIPYQTRVNFTTTTTYIDATLRLSVTPQITEAGTIIMDIAVQKTTPGQPIAGTEGTPLNTRQARTRVMVRDGGTAVIGGIYTESDTSSQNRVPVLHQIPVIGALFRGTSTNTTHDELLIFITPRIVRGS